MLGGNNAVQPHSYSLAGSIKNGTWGFLKGIVGCGDYSKPQGALEVVCRIASGLGLRHAIVNNSHPVIKTVALGVTILGPTETWNTACAVGRKAKEKFNTMKENWNDFRSNSPKEDSTGSSKNTTPQPSANNPPQLTDAPHNNDSQSTSQSSKNNTALQPPAFSLHEFISKFKKDIAAKNFDGILQDCSNALSSGSLESYDKAEIHFSKFLTLIEQGRAKDVIEGAHDVLSAQAVFDSFDDKDKESKLIILNAWINALLVVDDGKKNN